MAGTHENVPAVLEKGVHRHNKETGKAADQDQQRYGQPYLVDEIHDQNDQPMRCREE